MSKKTEFKAGDIVTCVGSRGMAFSFFKEYEVIDYSPEYMEPDDPSCFVWPAYVTVVDDNGVTQTVHADRFKKATD